MYHFYRNSKLRRFNFLWMELNAGCESRLALHPSTTPLSSSALANPEKRINQEDGKLQSFADVVNACKNTYSMAEIEAYWNAMKLYK